MERGITVRPNFQGCLENVLYISPSTEAILDILQNLQRQAPFYGLEQGMVGSGSMCEVSRKLNNYHFHFVHIFNRRIKLEIHIKTKVRRAICSVSFFFS